MSKITYTEKAPFQTNENVPIENKCTADDMNEIKEVVNTNADELENKQPKEEGKGLSTNDFTNEYKQKLDALTNYDDTEIKQEITNIKEEQTNQNEKIQQNSDNITEQNKNIEELKQENEKLKNNLINITTEQSSNINIKDCSDFEGSIDVEGNSVQKGEPTPENPVAIQNVEGNIDITVCNKNLFDKTKSKINYILTATGTEIVSEGAFISDYIFVKKGITYFSNTRGYSNAGFYDLDKQFIERKDLPQNSQFIPDNNYYIRLNGKIENIETLQFEIDNKSTEYTQHQQQTITFPLSEGQKLMKGDYLADDGIHHAIRVLELTGTEVYTEYNPTTYNPKNICSFKLQQILPKNANTNLALSSHFILKDLIQNNINPESGKFAYYTDEGLSNNSLYFSIDYTDIGVESTDTSEQKIQKFKDWIVQQKTNGNPVLIYYGVSKENEQIEVYTPEQQEAYNKLQKVLPYKLVTNISTDLALLKFNYIADTKTYIDNKTTNIQNQLNIINELLSTTSTSALLLDNMQTDLESEVI